MGWGFDIFQKYVVKFPAHWQIIPVKCNQISPSRLHIATQYPKAEPKKGIMKISPKKNSAIFIYKRCCITKDTSVPVTAAIILLSIIRVTLRRIRNLSGESPHFVSLNIPFLRVQRMSSRSFQTVRRMREAWKREAYVRSQCFSSESAVKYLHVGRRKIQISPSHGRTRSVKCPTPGPTKTIKSPFEVTHNNKLISLT